MWGWGICPNDRPILVLSSQPHAITANQLTAPLPAKQVNDEHAGAIIEALTQRRGELLEMGPADAAGAGGAGGTTGRQRLVFEVPSRGLIGFRAAFASATRGEGLLQRAFSRYAPHRGAVQGARRGVMVARGSGKVRRTCCWALPGAGGGPLEASARDCAPPHSRTTTKPSNQNTHNTNKPHRHRITAT